MFWCLSLVVSCVAGGGSFTTGCHKVVKLGDLQPDQEKELMVQRHLRQQQTAQLTQHDDAEIIED